MLKILIITFLMVMSVIGRPLEDIKSPKLLVLMVDGCRWDYLKAGMPGVQAVSTGGVKAEYITPEFPSVTHSNWLSLLSGTYPEVHGLINNVIYDKQNDGYYIFGLETKPGIQWVYSLPIYYTALMQKLKVSMYYWAACAIPYGSFKANCVEPAIPSPGPSFQQYEDSIDDAIDKLNTGDTNLAVLYLEQLDLKGHFYGPNSEQVETATRSLDNIIHNIYKKTMADQINVVMASDHGMTAISPSKAISITRHEDIDVLLVNPTITFIWPKDNMLQKVYNRFKNMHPNMTAYLKDELPEYWHIKNNHRIPPVTLVTDEGWIMIDESGYPKHNNVEYNKGDLPLLGYHGYNNTDVDMRGVFMAWGPDFKAGYKQPGFPLRDIYLVMNKVLGTQPMPNNATWSNIGGMFKGKAKDDDITRPKKPKSTDLRRGL